VKCASRLQLQFVEYNKDKNIDEQILIRIGIHLGDVIEFENKLKGDTLNIAARIQQTAIPGSIYISQSMYDAVKNKISVNIKSRGEQKLKNIKDVVNLYEVTI
jgi:class 3 adenylate cyclase